MGHLIIVAHPLIDSVTMKLARAYALELKQLGCRADMHDLYRMGFNPVLAATELEPLRNGRQPSSEIVQAQAAMASAEALTVIYPLWWATMPGILKGYIDRVFARGFAYEGSEGETKGLLCGKQCVLITLSGSPMAMLRESGDWGAIDHLQDSHIFRSCGFELLEHLHVGSVEPPITPATLAAFEERVRACARRHFHGSGEPLYGETSMAKYGKAAGKSVERAMHREKKGLLKSGKAGRGGTVRSKKQAIAIGLSEARKKGAKVPKKKN
jgi:NAD(P)H dehydrogenase (quinone)